MDGVGPVRGPDPGAFLKQPVWSPDRRAKKPPHEPETELEEEEQEPEDNEADEAHIDLEA